MQTTISERGQVSIPSSLRKKYRLKPGMEVEWLEKEEGIFLIPIPSDPIAAFRGKSKGLTKVFMESRQKERQRNRKR